MSAIDIFYIGLVLVAFSGFATALAYFSQRDRLPKGGFAAAAPKQAPAPAKVTAAKAEKVHEHA